MPPVLSLLLGLVALLAAGWFTAEAVDSAQAGVALHGDRFCEDGDKPPCLERLAGSIELVSESRRSPQQVWRLVDGDEIDRFEVGDSDEDRLAGAGTATALLHEGQVVAVELDDGRLHTLRGGARGASMALALALVCLGGAVWGIRLGRRRARLRGSWWTTRGTQVDAADGFAVAIIAPPVLWVLSMGVLGLPWWPGLVGVLLAAAFGARHLPALWREPAEIAEGDGYRGRHRG